MTEARPSLYLISPLIGDPASFAPSLAEACATRLVEAVLLRFEPRDERSLVNAVKALAPTIQKHEAAAIVADPGGDIDLATVIARGGADGGHANDPTRLEALGQRLKDGRNVGASGLKTKHDAMVAGEMGVDYVLFGEPRPDGYVPEIDLVEERAAWWAEIFQTPCVVYAPSIEVVARLAATGAEFMALGDVVWSHPAGPAAALIEVRRHLDSVPERVA